MPNSDLTNAHWVKSSRSANNGDCVEVAQLPTHTAIRDSKRPGQPALLLPRDTATRFAAAAKAGAFDLA